MTKAQDAAYETKIYLILQASYCTTNMVTMKDEMLPNTDRMVTFINAAVIFMYDFISMNNEYVIQLPNIHMMKLQI